MKVLTDVFFLMIAKCEKKEIIYRSNFLKGSRALLDLKIPIFFRWQIMLK